jgi:hypothetical protein
VGSNPTSSAILEGFGMVRIAILLGMTWTTAATAAPCTQKSIAGTWTLAGITAAEPGVEDFYRTAPHELMRFNADGTMIYVASNRRLASASAKAKLDEADRMPGTNFRYDVGADGTLMLSRGGRPFQAFQCAIAAANDAGAKPGDVVLTNVAGAPALRRIQRRVQ